MRGPKGFCLVLVTIGDSVENRWLEPVETTMMLDDDFTVSNPYIVKFEEPTSRWDADKVALLVAQRREFYLGALGNVPTLLEPHTIPVFVPGAIRVTIHGAELRTIEEMGAFVIEAASIRKAIEAGSNG